MSFGIWELVIILLIVALLFGTKRLSSMGTDLGKAIKGFRGAMKEEEPDSLEQKHSDSQANVIDGEMQEKQENSHHQA